MYHQGNRDLQDQFGSRGLADRLEERLRREQFNDDDATFIAGQAFFFLATADADGRPDCSFKGGSPGFVKVVSPNLLIFPDYDGNGMFKSLGNVAVNPSVGLLFISMGEKPSRLRVNGKAELCLNDPLMQTMPGAQILVKVTPVDIFPNCPRYVPSVEVTQVSRYLPKAEGPPIEPSWKTFAAFSDVVPTRRA